jgi:hypothetical protein
MLISFEFEFSLYRCELCEALFKYDILQILSTLEQRPFVQNIYIVAKHI